MKTVVITGVAGLLGNHLARHLLKKRYTVIGIDDLSGGYEDFLPKDDNFIFHKLCLGQDDISSVFDREIDCVFHFAAYAAVGVSPFIRMFNYQNNVVASAQVINECIKKNIKLVFSSSMDVYGDNVQPPYTEDMLLSPPDPYGIAKYAIEMDIKQAADQFGLRYTIIRPHNVFGIYQNIWDRYRNVIGIFIRRVLAKEPMLIYGDGEQTRAFSDIKYYMNPFEQLITGNSGETYNIGADRFYSIKDVAYTVQRVADKYNYVGRVEHVEPRNEVKHAFCDHEKAKKELDFFDNTDIETLIEEMFTWAGQIEPKEVKSIDYEVDKGVYSYWQ
tara:strand:- start:41 stop:1030 length:990 start_codon:yes stop_codon:yes gene_type:complete